MPLLLSRDTKAFNLGKSIRNNVTKHELVHLKCVVNQITMNYLEQLQMNDYLSNRKSYNQPLEFCFVTTY